MNKALQLATTKTSILKLCLVSYQMVNSPKQNQNPLFKKAMVNALAYLIFPTRLYIKFQQL